MRIFVISHLYNRLFSIFFQVQHVEREVSSLANRVVMVDVKKIRELASEQNMTLKKLESVSGISNGIISKWADADAGVDKLQRVADTLNTSIEKLLVKV